MIGMLFMVVGVGIIAIAGTAVAVLVGVRARKRMAVDLLRRFSRMFNPLQMRTAGSKGASTSVVRHVGRTSGRAYATPVDAIAVEDGFLIALPYGTQSHWVRNVLASGMATIAKDGEAYTVDRPELVPLETVATRFPADDQRSLRMFRVQQCLRLRRVGSVSAGDSVPLTTQQGDSPSAGSLATQLVPNLPEP